MGAIQTPQEFVVYQHILVPLDGSSASERGLREALSLATLSKGRLHLLHVVDVYPIMVEIAAAQSVAEYRLSLVQGGEALLHQARETARQASVQADGAVREVVHERVADVILDEARQCGCDLIVIGSHGRRGFTRWALGSDAERVVRASAVPVLVVHEAQRQQQQEG